MAAGVYCLHSEHRLWVIQHLLRNRINAHDEHGERSCQMFVTLHIQTINIQDTENM